MEISGRVFSVLTILTLAGATSPILIASASADFFGVEIVMGVVGLFVFLIGALSAKSIFKTLARTNLSFRHLPWTDQ